MKLKPNQITAIKKVIIDAINKKISEYKLIGDIKPFHEKFSELI
jgi:hypothetical protein